MALSCALVSVRAGGLTNWCVVRCRPTIHPESAAEAAPGRRGGVTGRAGPPTVCRRSEVTSARDRRRRSRSRSWSRRRRRRQRSSSGSTRLGSEAGGLSVPPTPHLAVCRICSGSDPSYRLRQSGRPQRGLMSAGGTLCHISTAQLQAAGARSRRHYAAMSGPAVSITGVSDEGPARRAPCREPHKRRVRPPGRRPGPRAEGEWVSGGPDLGILAPAPAPVGPGVE